MLYEYKDTLKKNLDNTLAANPQKISTYFSHEILGAGQTDLTVGFWGEMQRPKLGTQWDWMPRRVHLEPMYAVL